MLAGGGARRVCWGVPEKEGGACEEGEIRIGDVVLEERDGEERQVWPYP